MLLLMRLPWPLLRWLFCLSLFLLLSTSSIQWKENKRVAHREREEERGKATAPLTAECAGKSRRIALLDVMCISLMVLWHLPTYASVSEGTTLFLSDLLVRWVVELSLEREAMFDEIFCHARRNSDAIGQGEKAMREVTKRWQRATFHRCLDLLSPSRQKLLSLTFRPRQDENLRDRRRRSFTLDRLEKKENLLRRGSFAHVYIFVRRSYK